MLKRPYKQIYSLEHNNYYTLETSDVTFLVTESVLPYQTFWRKKEFTTAIKMLPLNSPILMAFVKALKLNKIGESDSNDGIEIEEYYETLDVKALRQELKKLVEGIEQPNHRFDYQKPAYNETVKKLIEEGFYLLTTELIGTYMRKQWLTRTDKNGVIRIVEVTLGGKPLSSKVVDVKFHTFNRHIIEKLLVEMRGEIK